MEQPFTTTEQESIIPTNDNILNSPSSNLDYLTTIVVDKMDMIPQEFQLPFVIVVSSSVHSFTGGGGMEVVSLCVIRNH